MTDVRPDWTQTQNDFYVGQLRHAYAQLVGGTVVDQEAFAKGLLGPAIRHFEKHTFAAGESKAS